MNIFLIILIIVGVFGFGAFCGYLFFINNVTVEILENNESNNEEDMETFKLTSEQYEYLMSLNQDENDGQGNNENNDKSK